MQHEIILRFGIWGFDDVTHEDIALTMNIKPHKIYVKGERKNPKASALAKENGWLFEITTDRQEPFESQFKNLLQILESRADVIVEL